MPSHCRKNAASAGRLRGSCSSRRAWVSIPSGVFRPPEAAASSRASSGVLPISRYDIDAASSNGVSLKLPSAARSPTSDRYRKWGEASMVRMASSTPVSNELLVIDGANSSE